MRRWLASLEGSPRLLLIFLLLPLQFMALLPIGLGPKGWAPLFASMSVALWAIWFVVLFMMAIPAADRWLRAYSRPLKWIALSMGVVLCLMGIIEVAGIDRLETGKLATGSGWPKTADEYIKRFGYNDGTAMIQVAAEDLIKGKNPYTSANLSQALDEFRMSPDRLTPLRQGDFAATWPYPTQEEIDRVWQEAKTDTQHTALDFESQLSYPAGSFLFVTPLLALGLKDLRYFYLLCMLLVFVVIMWQTPKKLWPVVILVALGSLELWNDIAAGGTAALYLLFLVLGWVLLKKNIWFSAAFMGLAIASKQLAWFFVLFYLILILRTLGWKRSIQISALIGGIFLAANIPFIVAGSRTWLQSVLSPVTAPMFPRGIGVVALSIGGAIPHGNNMIYSVLEIAILVVGLVWYYYNCTTYPEVGLVLAVLPLFFAWRSYSTYMSVAGVLVFASVLTTHGRSIGRGPSPDTMVEPDLADCC